MDRVYLELAARAVTMQSDRTIWMPDPSRAALGDRSLFPTLEPFAYLSHAAVSPPSTEVVRAVDHLMRDYAERGVSVYTEWRAQRDRLRGRIARLIGAGSKEIAFVANTTRSATDLSLCLPWKRGDRVLCMRGEFPANVTPWQRAAETFGLEIVFIEADAFRTDEGLAALDRELARGVRLVAVSAVQFQTGLAMPIDSIAARAHAAGAEIFVDAIQACGIVPIDVARSKIDYLGCGSHKWLMGLEGVAFLYVREDRISALVPRVAGWMSHESAWDFLFEPDSLRYDRAIRSDVTFFESGAINAAGLAALEASIACIEKLGVEAISTHVNAYLDALEPALVARNFASERSALPAQRSGILSVRPPADVSLSALWRALGERGVACSTPDGRLRFAPHWPNALDEVPRVIEALDACL
jgi:cysteine desulfurase / selenocysteine lyase